MPNERTSYRRWLQRSESVTDGILEIKIAAPPDDSGSHGDHRRALAILLLWETFDLNRSLQSVDHTDQILDQSGHLLTLLVDMESGTRGYIATGDENFLQPYLEGTKRLDTEYQALYEWWPAISRSSSSG